MFCDFFFPFQKGLFCFIFRLRSLFFEDFIDFVFFIFLKFFFKNSEFDTHGCFVAGERDCDGEAWALYREWRSVARVNPGIGKKEKHIGHVM